eukprot:SAG31_NODE_337_length_17493_cov_5.855755_8_plen_406_part_00
MRRRSGGGGLCCASPSPRAAAKAVGSGSVGAMAPKRQRASHGRVAELAKDTDGAELLDAGADPEAAHSGSRAPTFETPERRPLRQREGRRPAVQLVGSAAQPPPLELHASPGLPASDDDDDDDVASDGSVSPLGLPHVVPVDISGMQSTMVALEFLCRQQANKHAIISCWATWLTAAWRRQQLRNRVGGHTGAGTTATSVNFTVSVTPGNDRVHAPELSVSRDDRMAVAAGVPYKTGFVEDQVSIPAGLPPHRGEMWALGASPARDQLQRACNLQQLAQAVARREATRTALHSPSVLHLAAVQPDASTDDVTQHGCWVDGDKYVVAAAAAVMLQSIIRGVNVRRKLTAERDAASTIQAVARGQSTRRLIAAHKMEASQAAGKKLLFRFCAHYVRSTGLLSRDATH